MSILVDPKNFEKFLDKVLELDQKIRYVAIYDGQAHAKFKDGIIGYFKEEEIKSSLSEAQQRWESRKKKSFQIGEPVFAMAQYGKVNRITFPIGEDGVILVTTELHIDVNKLVDDIIEIRHNLENNVYGFASR